MKTSANIRKNLIAAVMMLSALSFTACSGSDSNDVVATAQTEIAKDQNTFAFNIRTFSQGSDVSSKGYLSDVTLYIFDQNNDFVKQQSVDKSVLLNARTIQVTAPGNSRITVIAWGGMNGSENVTSMNKANIISDLTVSLKQNNGVASLPGDMFFGQISLAAQTKSDDVATLKVERKVAAIDIAVSGIARKFGTTEGDFYFKVKQSKSAFNYNGEQTGADVEYIIPAYVTSTGVVAIDKTSIIPSANVVVELYRNDVKVFSVSKNKKGENLSTAAGEQLYVDYDVTTMSSTIYVLAYATVLQIANIG